MLGVHRVTFAKLYLHFILISSYLHSVDLYGKCREISYTWILYGIGFHKKFMLEKPGLVFPSVGGSQPHRITMTSWKCQRMRARRPQRRPGG